MDILDPLEPLSAAAWSRRCHTENSTGVEGACEGLSGQALEAWYFLFL